MMLDGKAMKYNEVLSTAPDFAKSFQVQLEAGDDEMLKSMHYLLSSLSDENNSLIGVKKLASNYLYMLIPIKGRDIAL